LNEFTTVQNPTIFLSVMYQPKFSLCLSALCADSSAQATASNLICQQEFHFPLLQLHINQTTTWYNLKLNNQCFSFKKWQLKKKTRKIN